MLSAVAGIVDRLGGLRVVVTQRWRMRYHVKSGERLFIVPGLEVREPVPWHDIPRVVRAAERHVFYSLPPPPNHCQECRQCCITGEVQDGRFNKPAHTPCKHLCASGCGIYFDRPAPCKSFRCEWLKSQGTNREMPATLRPDRCGVILAKNDYDAKTLFVSVARERPQALENPEVQDFLAREKADGVTAEVMP